MQLSIKSMLFLWLLLSFQAVHGQQLSHWLKVGTSIPYQYTLQYEANWSEKAFIAVESGLFAKVYQPVLFSAIDRKAESSLTSALMQSTFQSMRMHSLHIGWQLGTLQVSAFGQAGQLNGEGKPVDLIGTYYDVSPESLPNISFDIRTYQAGLSLGHRLPITKRLQLHTSVSVSRVLSAQGNLVSSINGIVSKSISGILGAQMQEAIQNYGFVPSVNIYFAYNFGKKKERRSKSSILARQ